MKSTRALLQRTLGIVMITMPLALPATAEMTMKRVQVKSCAAKGSPCLIVTSPEVQVSSFKPLYVLRNVTVEIETLEKGETKKNLMQSPQGYLDFDNDQLVLQSLDKNGTLTEQVFNLKTLERKTYITK